NKKSYGAIQRYQYGCRTRTKVYLTVPISYGLAIPIEYDINNSESNFLKIDIFTTEDTNAEVTITRARIDINGIGYII
ncbi:MAG: hypothetical protein O7C59_07505, partial [Rickettsia endosymbiont of Ixodes persulcatus]|nr:hypothetical protein [Rickettsia endosymbiont of Ixodes persulcatus]MCZ6914292.1 hypothetical protein [Rickettsia endosymbiont of Ixodes persulcatus]